MQPAIYRFTFNDSVPMADVSTTLHLAVLGAQGLFGAATVRMDASYSVDESGRQCVVDARNEVGRCICQMFTGFLARELGGDAFGVRCASAGQSRTDPELIGSGVEF